MWDIRRSRGFLGPFKFVVRKGLLKINERSKKKTNEISTVVFPFCCCNITNTSTSSIFRRELSRYILQIKNE